MNSQALAMTARFCSLIAFLLGVLIWAAGASDLALNFHMIAGGIFLAALWMLSRRLLTARPWIAAAGFILIPFVVLAGIAPIFVAIDGRLTGVLHLGLALAAIAVAEMTAKRLKLAV
ncbi:hypothetical protein J2R99_002369 [Rhodopseudomonas julia]|uniref:SPW repeat-containing protein n=1 Tax=Rhodopseudomonas julia TaxID=200617 RepID=A0ABU0C7M1_9BRAD|nr:hypothetical protein [Rhodopseudomonas julia]MDQ0326500.1 hypothetical protein [Rhodopseudomonas julia]